MIQPSSPSPEELVRPTDGASPPVEEAVSSRAVPLSREMLADGEVVVLHLKPSLWLIPLVSAPVVGLGIVLMLVANLRLVADLYPNGRSLLQQAGLWVIIARLVWAILQWVCRHYVLTDRRVIRQRGVLNIQVFECALDRLQNTFLQRTLVQRILGIGTIFFATAGTGAVEATWQHVKDPAAVHREITRAISRFRKPNNHAAP